MPLYDRSCSYIPNFQAFAWISSKIQIRNIFFSWMVKDMRNILDCWGGLTCLYTHKQFQIVNLFFFLVKTAWKHVIKAWKMLPGHRTAAMKILEIEVSRMSHLVGVGTWTPSRCKTPLNAEVIEVLHMWTPAMLAVHFSQSLKILTWMRRF